MTINGYKMFFDYLKSLRSIGKQSFTVEQAMLDLKMSRHGVLSAAHRHKKDGDLISPAKGFYVIIPPEHQGFGCIPPEELVPILMQHLNVKYYSALLTAAQYHGATHQKPGSFQIIAEKQIKRKLKFGKVRIDCIYKKSLKNLPIQNITVRTGYLKLASPEITAIDLLKYPHKCGGLNHIATVLSELIETIDAKKLIALSEKINENVCLQRLGYILEQIDPMDTAINQKIIDALYQFLSLKKLIYTPLAPELPRKDFPRSKKWKIIENTSIESDL